MLCLGPNLHRAPSSLSFMGIMHSQSTPVLLRRCASAAAAAAAGGAATLCGLFRLGRTAALALHFLHWISPTTLQQPWPQGDAAEGVGRGPAMLLVRFFYTANSCPQSTGITSVWIFSTVPGTQSQLLCFDMIRIGGTNSLFFGCHGSR